MLRNNKRLIVHLLILFCLSLLPFFWLKNGQAVLGHDAGFPLSPWEHFLDRLLVWSHRFGLGNDQTTEVGGFFIHGFEGVVAWLGFSLTRVQQITFTTYFFGFGVSMYVLARELFPDRKKYLPLFAGMFYMYNHFILQAWFIVERTKFTLYIALPLLIALMIRVTNKKTHPIVGGVLAALVIFFLNGGGFFPLFGAIIITIPFLLVCLLIFDDHRRDLFIRLTKFVVTWGIGALFICAFWIVPYIRFIFTSYSTEVGAAGGFTGVVAWITSISEHTSFYNLFRLQGIPEWFANPRHPYAETFLTNTFLRIISYIIPLLAFGGYFVSKDKKEKKIIIILIGLALYSMLFVAGSHPPFGFIYLWLVQHIPGFIAFRTPFYKFAPALWLAYSLLLAYSISYLIDDRIKNQIAKIIGIIAFVTILGIYNYPLIIGNFFDYEVNHKTTRVTVPEYVYEYGKWANSKDFPYKRLLLLPGQNPDTRFEAYTWGYWSLAQLQGLLDNQSYIGNSLYKAASEEVFIKNLYDLMEKGDPSWVEQAEYLFVDAVLLRKDFDYKLENSPTVSPFDLEKFLDNDPRFKKTKVIGEWSVYELQKHPQSFAFKDYYYEIQSQDKEKFFEPATLPGIQLDSRTIFLDQNLPELQERRKGIVYIPWCVHCLLENRRVYEIDHNQIVTAGSLFYEAQLEKDRKKLEAEKKPDKKLDLAARTSLKRLFQLQSQFFRKADVKERVIGLQELIHSLKTEQDLLDKYYQSFHTYSFANNAFLEVLYENTDQMFSELQVPMQEINQESEAALYMEIQQRLSDIKKKITNRIWYSESNTSKKYFLEVSDPGTYELFIKKPTSNAFSELKVDRSEIKVHNNNVAYPVQIATSDNSQWAKLTDIQLNNGINRIEVNEPLAQAPIGNGSATLSFSNEHKCTEMPMGYLDRNTYILNFKAHSLKNLEDFYIFVDQTGTTMPLLPYRGIKFNMEGEKTSYLDFKHLVLIPENYTIKFCRLTNDPITPHTIQIDSMHIERISVPVIALLKKNISPLQEPTQLTIQSHMKNKTAYDLTMSGTGKSLLMFDQRYDDGWQFSKNSIITKHLRLHGYANGWIVSKTDKGDTNMQLTYIGQKLFIIGWIISLSTFVTFIIGLGYFYLKKK